MTDDRSPSVYFFMSAVVTPSAERE